jgi:hypothetical protein
LLAVLVPEWSKVNRMPSGVSAERPVMQIIVGPGKMFLILI